MRTRSAAARVSPGRVSPTRPLTSRAVVTSGGVKPGKGFAMSASVTELIVRSGSSVLALSPRPPDQFTMMSRGEERCVWTLANSVAAPGFLPLACVESVILPRRCAMGRKRDAEASF